MLCHKTAHDKLSIIMGPNFFWTYYKRIFLLHALADMATTHPCH